MRLALILFAAVGLVFGASNAAVAGGDQGQDARQASQAQANESSESSEADIVVTFSDDCTDFVVESTKDISFVSVNFDDDFSYQKIDGIDAETFEHEGDRPIKSIVVKSGTTTEVFNCPDGGGEVVADPDERPECDDGQDNDGDGLVDHPGGMGQEGAEADPGCEAPDDDDERDPATEPGDEGPQGDETCDDGVDNDGDGLTDGDDPDCDEGAQGGEFCDDGIDNDGDGLTDGEDSDCDGGSEGPQGDETCDDGVDNDGDGLTDGDDPDCDEGAQGGEFCDDGIDNDGDGLTDGDDPDCDGGPEPTDVCTAEAGDPGIVTEDTLGQTLWDGGADALSPLTEDPEADGALSGPVHDGGNDTPVEPVTDEAACAADLLIDPVETGLPDV